MRVKLYSWHKAWEKRIILPVHVTNLILNSHAAICRDANLKKKCSRSPNLPSWAPVKYFKIFSWKCQKSARIKCENLHKHFVFFLYPEDWLTEIRDWQIWSVSGILPEHQGELAYMYIVHVNGFVIYQSIIWIIY